MPHKKAFTLLELIIVIIIISILASLALPAYQRTTERARVAEAKSMLSAIRSSQLRYYTQWGSYTNNVGRLDMDFPSINGTRGVGKYFDYYVWFGGLSPVGYAGRTSLDRGKYNAYWIYIYENGTFWISNYQYLL